MHVGHDDCVAAEAYDLLRASMDRRDSKDIAMALLGPEPVVAGAPTRGGCSKEEESEVHAGVGIGNGGKVWNVLSALKSFGVSVKSGPGSDHYGSDAESGSRSDASGPIAIPYVAPAGDVTFSWSSPQDFKPPVMVDFADPFQAGSEASSPARSRASSIFQTFPGSGATHGAHIAVAGGGVKIPKVPSHGQKQIRRGRSDSLASMGSCASFASDISTYGSKLSQTDIVLGNGGSLGSVSTCASFSSSPRMVSLGLGTTAGTGTGSPAGGHGLADSARSWRKAPLNPTAVPFTGTSCDDSSMSEPTTHTPAPMPSLPLPKARPLPSSLPAKPGLPPPVSVRKESAVLPQLMGLPGVQPLGPAWASEVNVSGNERRRRSSVGMDGLPELGQSSLGASSGLAVAGTVQMPVSKVSSVRA